MIWLTIALCGLAGLLLGLAAGTVSHYRGKRRMALAATLAARRATTNVRVIPPEQVRGPWSR